MADRITKDDIRARVQNLNRRLRPQGVSAFEHDEAGGVHIGTGYRNGAVALDEYRGTALIRTITVGTKREVYDFLGAAIVGIDLSRQETDDRFLADHVKVIEVEP